MPAHRAEMARFGRCSTTQILPNAKMAFSCVQGSRRAADLPAPLDTLGPAAGSSDHKISRRKVSAFQREMIEASNARSTLDPSLISAS